MGQGARVGSRGPGMGQGGARVGVDDTATSQGPVDGVRQDKFVTAIHHLTGRPFTLLRPFTFTLCHVACH